MLGVCSAAYYFEKVDAATYRNASVLYLDFNPTNTNMDIHNIYGAKSKSYRQRFANTICESFTSNNMEWLVAISFNNVYYTTWAAKKSQGFVDNGWWRFPECLLAWGLVLALHAFTMKAWRAGRSIRGTVAIVVGVFVAIRLIDYGTS